MRTNLFAIACGAVFLSIATPSWAEPEIDYLENLYLHLHQNPELSLQEFETSKRMAAELKLAGYDVTTDIGGTGLRACHMSSGSDTL